jgi:hypothetical protein
VRVAPFQRTQDAHPAGEAAILAQGVTPAPFLDDALVRELLDVLAGIRAHVPDLRATVPEGSYWAVEIVLSDSAAAVAKRHGRYLAQGHFLHHWQLSRTGDRELDSLAVAFHAESLALRQGRGPGDRATPVVRFVFSYAMNLPVVLSVFSRVEAVRAAFVSPDDGPQTGHFYRVARIPEGWRVVVDQGQGSCLPVCGSWIRWTIRATEPAIVIEDRQVIRER